MELVKDGERSVAMFRASTEAVAALRRACSAKEGGEPAEPSSSWLWGTGRLEEQIGAREGGWWAALPRDEAVWRAARRGDKEAHGQGLLREWERLHLQVARVLRGRVALTARCVSPCTVACFCHTMLL